VAVVEGHRAVEVIDRIAVCPGDALLDPAADRL